MSLNLVRLDEVRLGASRLCADEIDDEGDYPAREDVAGVLPATKRALRAVVVRKKAVAHALPPCLRWRWVHRQQHVVAHLRSQVRYVCYGVWRRGEAGKLLVSRRAAGDGNGRVPLCRVVLEGDADPIQPCPRSQSREEAALEVVGLPALVDDASGFPRLVDRRDLGEEGQEVIRQARDPVVGPRLRPDLVVGEEPRCLGPCCEGLAVGCAIAAVGIVGGG